MNNHTDSHSINKYDSMTGLLTRQSFIAEAHRIIASHKPNSYILSCIDVDNFKLINDRFGHNEGDRLLKYISNIQKTEINEAGGLTCRATADVFLNLLPNDKKIFDRITPAFLQALDDFDLPINISVHIGRYYVDEPDTDVNLMIDRATMALRSIKASADITEAFFTDEMRIKLLGEQELVSEMRTALKEGQFIPYYQPQFDYPNNKMIGAEALVRWNHPKKGLISPAIFIPLFERNGFITALDKNIIQQVCKQQRRWIDKGITPLPVSVNISRNDIRSVNLPEFISNLLRMYQLSPELLHVEITESAYTEQPQELISTINSLQDMGLTVEMDDFGTGYSSLNILKDVPIDVLKLDMKFNTDTVEHSRGGSILSSVVRMAHLLDLPVIAEGVETQQQADFLKSIGCFLMQGFLFSQPVSTAEYENMLFKRPAATDTIQTSLTDIKGAVDFLNASTQSTLLFNSFVGGALIIEFDGTHAEALRINERFFDEMDCTPQEYYVNKHNILSRFYPESRDKFIDALKRAVSSGDETQCELHGRPFAPGKNDNWVLARFRFLAKNVGRHIFYVSVENITARKENEEALRAENERNRLLLETNRLAVFDYNTTSDTLSLQANTISREQFVTIIPHFLTYLSSNKTMDPDFVDVMKDAIEAASLSVVTDRFDFKTKLWHDDYSWTRIRYSSIADDSNHVNRIIGILSDVSKEKQLDKLREDLNQKNPEENALTYEPNIIADIFAYLYDAKDIDGAINHVLNVLGEFYHVSRVYVFENTGENNIFSNTYEWCAEGIMSQKHNLENVDYNKLFQDYFANNFDEKGLFVLNDVMDLPQRQRGHFIAQDIHAMLQWTITNNGKLSGFIGFDDCTGARQWSPGEMGTLSIISGLLGLYLYKKRINESQILSGDFITALNGNRAYIYIIDPEDYGIIFVNKALEERFGHVELGSPCYKLAGREEACHNCPIKALQQSGTSQQVEYLRPDGIWLLTQASPIHWNNRDMYMVACSDISERKKLSDEVEMQKEQMEALIANSPCGIIVISANENGSFCEYFSEGLSRMLKYEYGVLRSMFDKNISAAVYSEDIPRVNEAASKAIADISPFNENYRLVCSDGSIIWVNLTGNPVNGLDGILRFYCTYTNITDTIDTRNHYHTLTDALPSGTIDTLGLDKTLMRILAKQSQKYIVIYDFATDTFKPLDDSINIASNVLPLYPSPSDYLQADIIAKESLNEVMKCYEGLKSGKPENNIRFRARALDGSWRWLVASLNTVFSNVNTPVYAVATFEDITDSYEMELTFKRYEKMVEKSAQDRLWYVDYDLTQNRMEGCSVDFETHEFEKAAEEGFTSFIKYISANLVYTPDSSTFRDYFASNKLLHDFFKGKSSDSIDLRILHPEYNRPVYVRFGYQMIVDPYTSNSRIFLSCQLVDDEKRAEIELITRAEMDDVTQIYNRRTFVSKANEMISSHDGKQLYAFAIVDVDNFKFVNDNFGHITGDKVLRTFAKTIRSILFKDDLSGRLGGDEFGIFFGPFPSKETVEDKIDILHSALNRDLDDGVCVSASIGISLFPEDGSSLRELYQKADIALYQAKNEGRNRFKFYLT